MFEILDKNVLQPFVSMVLKFIWDLGLGMRLNIQCSTAPSKESTILVSVTNLCITTLS